MNTPILYLATSDGPIVVTRRDGRWEANRSLDLRASADSKSIHACIAHDLHRPGRAFYGLPEQGIWRTDDAGATWRQVFHGLPHRRVTALAVAAPPRSGDPGIVYAGTEPGALFGSEDGGETWWQSENLSRLPSAGTWSFPPRPDSHHTRWIQPVPKSSGCLFMAIEAGALLASADGGRTWWDRIPSSPIDTHQLAIHPSAPDHLWSAAGDGIFESRDGGTSWKKNEQGLRFYYGWSVAIEAGDPQTVVLSAAPSAREAHWTEHAESAIFRREGSGSWREVRAGLPDPKGILAPVVAGSPREPGVFYAAINHDLYCSADAGKSWNALPISWPTAQSDGRFHALAVAAA
jgi:photosystem II stability/assembly factor-like uncharacterized protein